MMSYRLSLYLNLIRWDRPAGWLLLLWPTLSALWIASHGWPGWHLVLVFVAGTVLMRSAGCCINDVADREFDRHVERTAQRPVTSGKLPAREALLVGAVLALAAFALVLTLNRMAMYTAFAALAVAVAYPYAKRFLAMPQAVLGVAFSLGIPMAFAAVQSRLPWLVWLLLLGNLFWVLAYDTEYAMVDRDDDLKVGMKTSAISLGERDVPAIMVFYAIYTLIWSIVLMEYTYNAILIIAILIIIAQVAWHWHLIRRRGREDCFTAFRANHWLGFTWFAAIATSYALR